MTPEQAAQAASLLQATVLMPMHFGVHQPPIYVEEVDAVSRVIKAAGELGIRVVTPEPGVRFDLNENAVG